MDFAEMEKQGWSDASIAATYASDFAKASEMAIPAMIDAVNVRQGDEVLDLCCGHGIVAEALVATGARVLGLDFSPAMLDMARSRVPSANFTEGDAMNLPFDAGRFDAVTVGFGIPHVPDPAAAMVEARRVLKSGGRFAYSVWDGVVDSAMAYVTGAAATFGSTKVKMPAGPGATEFAEMARAIPALEAAGFGNIARVQVASNWTVSDPAAPYDYFLTGTVRGSALLKDQPEENQRAIRQAVINSVEALGGPTGPWTVPIPSVVISATAI